MSVGKAWGLPVAVAALAASLVAALGATITDLGPWYQSLRQPDWAPPDIAFGPIWTVVFACTAIAGVTAWRAAPDGRRAETVIALFALNGFLNLLWSMLFFRAHRPDWAVIEVALLWLSIVALIVVCGRHSRPAALLLLPYLLWVSIASVLNWQVVQLNGPFG